MVSSRKLEEIISEVRHEPTRTPLPQFFACPPRWLVLPRGSVCPQGTSEQAALPSRELLFEVSSR